MFRFLGFCAVLSVSVATPPAQTHLVPVRYEEGLVHGFLTLRTTAGTVVANGDLIQVARGDRVTSRLTFHFTDGSVQDETAIFSQRTHFQLTSYRLIQTGAT